jgi:hypothetical protein
MTSHLYSFATPMCDSRNTGTQIMPMTEAPAFLTFFNHSHTLRLGICVSRV